MLPLLTEDGEDLNDDERVGDELDLVVELFPLRENEGVRDLVTLGV